MNIYRTTDTIWVCHEACWYRFEQRDWDTFINRERLYNALEDEIQKARPEKAPPDNLKFLKPIQGQELWAAGVTYLRSRTARMQESEKAGGDTFYDKVYRADRPELFFKATADRIVGPAGEVRIRRDSGWDVPEPELTLFISSKGTIEGYTIGNDMSSRAIEGANPLYLPQAKTYSGCAALGPCIHVPKAPLPQNTEIRLQIVRGSSMVFEAGITIDQMKRTPAELVAYLFRECEFKHGVFLMTGTGIIPPDDFSLAHGDRIAITIPPIGTLTNSVGK